MHILGTDRSGICTFLALCIIIMYLITAEKWAITAPIGRGKARGVEIVRGAHRETELRKKLKPTQPANSSVRPWKGGVPIYKVQFGGGAN